MIRHFFDWINGLRPQTHPQRSHFGGTSRTSRSQLKGILGRGASLGVHLGKKEFSGISTEPTAWLKLQNTQSKRVLPRFYNDLLQEKLTFRIQYSLCT